MLQKFRKRMESEKGFTLIELLVVILIIGILAAIALPAFLNQREKGQDSTAKSGARTAATAMETCSTDNSGAYTTCTAAIIKGIEPALNNAKNLTVTAAAAKNYAVRVESDNGRTFTITRADSGTITRTCSAAGGGCKAADTNGNQW